MITDDLLKAIETCREDIERKGSFQDITLSVRADAIDVKITKRIRCFMDLCEDINGDFPEDAA